MSKNFEHVMISRAELAEVLLKAKGFDPDKVKLVNMDIRSTEHQKTFPLYMGDWTNTLCPFDLFTFGVEDKE